MRAFSVVSTTSGMASRQTTASAFTVNPLQNVIYSNYNYADPMFADVAAKPTNTIVPLAQRALDALNTNLYRIFYPTAADKVQYAAYNNLWESPVCKAP
jgi:hypothetical protein